jgi:hypothetical protein
LQAIYHLWVKKRQTPATGEKSYVNIFIYLPLKPEGDKK